MATTLSTIFGILIATAFVRFGRFRARLLLSALASAPLVIPEVVMGLSMLLLFIGMEKLTGWPSGRGLIPSSYSCHIRHVFCRCCHPSTLAPI